MDYKYRYKKGQKRLEVPEYILDRVYNCTLSFNEFIEYQLDDKIPTSCIREFDRKIVDKFGIEKCKELDWEVISGAVNHHIDITNILMSIDAQTEDVNYALYELVKNMLPPSAYSQKMSQIYSDRLFDLSEEKDWNIGELKSKFNSGRVDLNTIINNWELFKNKDLSYCLLKDSNNKNNITDSSLKEFMKNYGAFVPYIMGDKYTFINTILNSSSEEELFNYLKQSTDNILTYWTIVADDTTLSDEAYKEIFKYSSIEEYLKLEFDDSFVQPIIEELKTLPKDYIFNTPIPVSVLLNYEVLAFIQTYGLKNIVDFDNECGHFFTKNNCEMLKLMYDMSLYYDDYEYDPNKTIHTKKNTDENGNYVDRPYTKDEFYEAMRRMVIYRPSVKEYDYIQFDCRNITGEFRERNKDLYLPEQAPEELQKLFYASSITPQLLVEHPEFIQFLNGKKCGYYFKSKEIWIQGHEENFYDFISSKTDFNTAMNFIIEYRDILDAFISESYYEIDSFNKIQERIDDNLKRLILEERIVYPKHIPQKFIEKHPSLFLNSEAPKELQEAFYNRTINSEFILSNPTYKKYLENIDLEVLYKYMPVSVLREDGRLYYVNLIDIIKQTFDAKDSFDIMLSYSKYIESVFEANRLQKFEIGPNFSKDDLLNKLDRASLDAIFIRKIKYDESMPSHFKDHYPMMFLSSEAPNELKEVFYTSNSHLTFELLSQHKDWLPYLEGKLLSLAFGIPNIEQLFKKYGVQEALKIGMNNLKSVESMLNFGYFELLSQWYDKFHFLPHHVVMEEFPFEQADKFVASRKKWSGLMKSERHNNNADSISALLKASMCFGVFDNDSRGFNEIIKLFFDVPKTLSSQDMQRMIDFIQKQISSLGDNPNPKMLEDYNKQLTLIQQCYGQSEEGLFLLKINSQKSKDTVQTLRSIMEEANVSTILTPDKAHKLFGGFEMKYEPGFREFILKNMDTILSSDEYIAYISSMQKQWAQINAFNSNRGVTLDLAKNFITSNKYENIQFGNEKLAEVSSMAGYDQESFNALQQIYNYGKSRVFSSIPRVHVQNGEYTYEILRLDDPLAVAIGTLTDCCQELGNAAETCMEHSMVDKNGRVFVIKDKSGNIVAQSWVWRNQNVLCFDNIEIPEKALTRAERGGSSREHFADKVFELYQQAAQELIAKDEEEFKKLLDKGKITEEQYEALKLGKVTVGRGYNDIADSLERKSQLDSSKVARPLDFVSPVKLRNDLYTSDSETQYVIAGNEVVSTSTYETPTIYSDEFVIHDNENTTHQDVLMLRDLEFATREDSYSGKTQSVEAEKIISDIAYNYGLNPETTRIIMNANFAIIYDTTSEEVIVGDVLYNTSFYNNGQQVDISDKVAMQIRMAIEQIGVKGKKINISRLSQEQLKMCNKAMNLETEIDEERGLSHGAR